MNLVQLDSGNRFSHASVLFLGHNLKEFGTLVIDSARREGLHLDLFFTTRLPVKEFCEVNFVVIAIDLSNKDTYINAKESINYLSRDVFHGHLLFIVKKCRPAERMFEIRNVQSLASECCASLLWDIPDGTNNFLASQILGRMKVAIGMTEVSDAIFMPV